MHAWHHARAPAWGRSRKSRRRVHCACEQRVALALRAQAELGDVVFVELPEVGKQVKQGETFGVVESVKVNVTSALPGRGRMASL